MSNENGVQKKKQLPQIADLTKEADVAHKNDELNLLLNQEPPQGWIKRHPFIKNYDYLPIDKIELMLRRIFKSYKIEVIDQGTAFNGVWVTARVHYLHPVTNEWSFHDGIGGAEMQTKKGESAADLAAINNGALAMAFPIAKARAVKNACAQFGKLFGSDLNREDTLAYTTDPNLAERANEKAQMTDYGKRMAIESLKEGAISMEYIESMYKLTDDQRQELEQYQNA